MAKVRDISDGINRLHRRLSSVQELQRERERVTDVQCALICVTVKSSVNISSCPILTWSASWEAFATASRTLVVAVAALRQRQIEEKDPPSVNGSNCVMLLLPNSTVSNLLLITHPALPPLSPLLFPASSSSSILSSALRQAPWVVWTMARLKLSSTPATPTQCSAWSYEEDSRSVEQ